MRAANQVEAPALARLQLRVALAAYSGIFPPQAPQPTIEELGAEWGRRLAAGRDSRTEVFVAVEGDEILGVAVAEPDSSADNVGHLSRLYVDDRWWGRGVGTRLYGEVVGHLRGQGFLAATLWVLEANRRARAWYERLGWEPTGQRKVVWAPGAVDDVGYRLAFRGRRIEVDAGDLDRWCASHVGEGVAEELFRAGYLSTVIGIRLRSGRRVVVKIRRPSRRLAACSEVHRRLFAAGYPCPELLSACEPFDDLEASVEALVPGGETFPASGRSPGPFAAALATLIRLAPDPAEVGSLEPSLPWTAADHTGLGLWPWPDDRDVDLNAVEGSPAWIDRVGQAVRERLTDGSGRPVIGHGDWYTGNLRWADNRLHVVWDWDSVIAAGEPRIVGLAASMYPATVEGTEATVAETEAFLAAYQHSSGRKFSNDELEQAWAAGLWCRCFDTKKQLATEGRARSLTEQEATERLRRAVT